MNTTESKSLQIKHEFAVSAEKLFDAWVMPNHIEKWITGPSAGKIARIETNALECGTFNFVVNRLGEEISHTGEYLEFLRPLRLKFTWCVPKYSYEESIVSIQLLPTLTGTALTLTHENIPAEYFAASQKGWNAILKAIEHNLK